ncbi:hypothetical protein DEO72_LG9g3100 [Vigna unguiculata]|uniref:Uncharacterized protein n=1 Tax=Vigna unguiculata TaxID=3917 RepID=A0A4D6N2S9_VIGUN|nr:hypothetical protein DEO72_LG9g3100 [Vigna unguiculata]
MQRFPPLVCASIALAISVVRIGAAIKIGLGRCARVVVSGKPSLPFSSAYANHLFSLTPGSEAIVRNSFNNEGNGAQCFHNTTIIVLG